MDILWRCLKSKKVRLVVPQSKKLDCCNDNDSENLDDNYIELREY
jgi:hypothetical protein